MQIKYKFGGNYNVSVGKENPRTYYFNPFCDVSIDEDAKLILEHTKTKDMFELVKQETKEEISNKPDNLIIEESQEDSFVKEKSGKLENVCLDCGLQFKTKSILKLHFKNLHKKKIK